MFAIVTKLCIIGIFAYNCAASNVSDRYYPYYHLAPPHGWMNDPNGFSVFCNEYHLFYQYNPLTSLKPGIAHWGHAKSDDLFHWKHLPIAMYPDQNYDINGVFSGSAVVDNNTMYILYTGNVNHPGENPDHNNREALAYSEDGLHFSKYPNNPVIEGNEFQPNFRDPKVWKNNDTFYMVLGNSFKCGEEECGRVLLFSSKNLSSWQFETVLGQSNGSLGYMWECPDFFELNGKYVLLFSPQGVQPQGDKYNNLYQVVYLVGDFNYETLEFTITSEFKELDHGHDFYATQTMIDKFGRRIMIAWFDMWEQIYPERNDGWAGEMTIPRELILTPEQKLIQRPVKEIIKVRGDVLYSDKPDSTTSVKIRENAGEILVTAPSSQNLQVYIEGKNQTVNITYDFSAGKISLDRGGNDSLRRTEWRPKDKLQMQIFVDRSSVEVFCGGGEITISTRFFPGGQVYAKFGENSTAEHITIYSMKQTVPAPS